MDARTANDTGVPALPASARREIVASAKAVPAARARANAAPSLVRVLGQVRRAGRPLAGYGLSFLTPSPGRDLEERDWGFTDEEGRYEVEIPAARYVVWNEDGDDVTEVVVSGGRNEFYLDIDLRPAR